MSGGGYSAPISSQRSPGDDDCAKLRFTCVLAGVDPDVLAATATGDVGEVVLRGVPPTQALEVVVDGESLGSIVDRWDELIACINRGVEFSATMVEATEPVRVRVAPK